jgi:hypothetical protein
MRKVLIVAAVALLPFLVAAPAAQAQTNQICGNGGSGYCITSGGNPDTPLSVGYGEATCWGISG